MQTEYRLVLCGLLVMCASAASKDQDVRLNNFVVEHVNATIKPPAAGHDPKQPVKSFTFQSVREGWIFVSAKAAGAGARVSLDSPKPEDAILTVDRADEGPVEAMRLVGKGPHTAFVFAQAATGDTDMIVRSIPMIQVSELHFAVMPKQRPPSGHNRKRIYEWDFYKKYVVPHINVIISTGDDKRQWAPYATEFRSQGKKWVFKTEAGIDIGLLKKLGTDGFEEYYYEKWGKPLEQIPYLDGIAIDEWTSAKSWADAYPIFARIFDRIARNPATRSKKLYIYGQAKHRDWYKPGVQSIRRNNFVYLLEGYFFLAEGNGTTEEQQTAFITGWAGGLIGGSWAKLYPGFVRNNLTYVVSMFDYHYSFDQTPAMDYKVFLDLQFYHLANYPTLKGLYGVSLYATPGTTKNTLQYAAALARHYCIEGRRERFNTDPLRLSHLKNPGFEEDLAYWDIQAAESNSVRSISVKDLPFQKRFSDQMPPSQQKVLCTVRSAKAANVISQTITGLQPGRLYSLTVYDADLTDMGHWDIVPVTIKLDNVEDLPAEAEDRDITTPDYKDGRMRCWNYHLRVFRAKTPEAQLTLSDWANPDSPGGEVGHQVLWDHIKLQPYFAADKLTQAR